MILHHKEKPRLFSWDQVNRTFKAQLEPRLQLLKRQLDDKQQLIKFLNDRLNENDSKLNNQIRQIQRLKQKYTKALQNEKTIVRIIEQSLYDKLESKYEQFANALKQIRQSIESSQRERLIRTDESIEYLKKEVSSHLSKYKSRMNLYWQNVKQTLSRLYSRLNKMEEEVKQIKFLEVKDFNIDQMIKKIQYGQHLVSKLVIFEQEMQNCQRGLQELAIVKKKINFKEEDDQDPDLLLNPFWSQFEQTNRKKRQKKVTIKRQNIDVGNNGIVPLRDVARKSFDKRSDSTNQKIIHRESHTDYMKMRTFEMVSPTVCKPIPIKFDPSRSPQSIFSLNSSSPPLHSNSLLQLNLNCSMESRKQMTESIRERLLELFHLKKIAIPFPCRLDDLGYIRNSSSNYLFDLKGNMFRLEQAQFQSLRSEGIITNLELPSLLNHS